MGVFQKTALLSILVVFAAGCRSDGTLFPPAGTVEQQRHNATMYDPYSDVDTGPEVEGGRPRDFQNPLSEADRSRMFQDNQFSVQ